jgi:hypothetical protein
MAKTTTRRHLADQGLVIKDKFVAACTGLGVKKLLQASQQWLEAHVQVVNNLNVFPVPDGDTGTNMLLTLRSAVAAAQTAPDKVAGMVLEQAAYGALMGARGNSGVIFSQFLQGMADSLAGESTITAANLAEAVQKGTDRAYQSVTHPVEGTILTVARAAAVTARHSCTGTQDVAAIVADMLQAARVAQAQTPDLLPILRQAGVTDSGGQGFVYILEGWQRFLAGQPLQPDPDKAIALTLAMAPEVDRAEYGYDVQFLIHGHNLNIAEIRAQVDRLGWSTLVVGDTHTVKVHIHASDPGQPLSYGASLGHLSDVVVENMQLQARQFVQERFAQPTPMTPALALPAHMTDHLMGVVSYQKMLPYTGQPITEMATVCVAPSQGLAQILESLGASQVVLGGQTMNPSPQELLEAIDRVEANDVLILPNNSNVIMAAQQAQKLSSRQVRVVPTKTIPQGIAALLSLNYQADLDRNARLMLEAAQQVQTIEITRAVRDTTLSGFQIKSGNVMGLFNDELVSVGVDVDSVTLEVLAKVSQTHHELITIYFGQDSSAYAAEAVAEKIKALYPDMEIECHNGGQPYYYYIISLE